jgi:hypothetical protein
MRKVMLVSMVAHTAVRSDIGTCASSQGLANAIIIKVFERGSPERHALLRKRWQGRLVAPGNHGLTHRERAARNTPISMGGDAEEGAGR